MLFWILFVAVQTTGVSNIICRGLNIYSSCFPHQEVLLKRAADLVEALYGMPHNNQVRIHAAASASCLHEKKTIENLLIESPKGIFTTISGTM